MLNASELTSKCVFSPSSQLLRALASVLMEPNETKLTKGDSASDIVVLNRVPSAGAATPPIRLQLALVQLATHLVSLNISSAAVEEQRTLSSALLGSTIPTKASEIAAVTFPSASSPNPPLFSSIFFNFFPMALIIRVPVPPF